jgi:hypothetical protein
MGDWRLNTKWANYSPFMGQVVNNQVRTSRFSSSYRTYLGLFLWRYSLSSYFSPSYPPLFFFPSLQVLFMNPPSFSYRTQVTYNTSNAGSTHFLRYIDGITSGLDFEFAFKVRRQEGRGEEGREEGGELWTVVRLMRGVSRAFFCAVYLAMFPTYSLVFLLPLLSDQVDDDFGNIYEAWRVMIEESENMWREKDMIPLNIFSAIRWVGASSCPLSHAYGEPGERFAMLEPTSSHGTSKY